MLPGTRPECNTATRCCGQARGHDCWILNDFIISGEARCWAHWQWWSPGGRHEGCVLPLWIILPSTSMFSRPRSSIKQTCFFAPQLLLQCSFLEREIGLHNQSVLVEVGKQRMSLAQMNSTLLVCSAVLQGHGVTGVKILSLFRGLGSGYCKGLAGHCCNVMLLPWLL